MMNIDTGMSIQYISYVNFITVKIKVGSLSSIVSKLQAFLINESLISLNTIVVLINDL